MNFSPFFKSHLSTIRVAVQNMQQHGSHARRNMSSGEDESRSVVDLVYGGYAARKSMWGQISDKKIIDLDKRMKV
jgi:hypothetical protein